MSNDTIKRSDAIKAVEKRKAKIVCNYESNKWFNKTISEIEAIPSADRPQGEWFKDDEGTFICSACGNGYKDQPTLMGKPMFEWCPLCGARMKG